MKFDSCPVLSSTSTSETKSEQTDSITFIAPQGRPGQDLGSKSDSLLLLNGDRRYTKIRNLTHNSGNIFVELCHDSVTNTHVAVKKIRRGAQLGDKFLQELLSQFRLRHHHVTSIKNAYLSKDYLCLVMEYAEGGDLFTKCTQGRFTESMTRWLFQQLAISIDYCHRMGVVDRDITLENALLDDNQAFPMLKLGTGGYKQRLMQFGNAPRVPRIATVAYFPPEVFSMQAIGDYCPKAADMWRCGVFLYVLAFKRLPFDSHGNCTNDRLIGMIQKIIEAKITFPEEKTAQVSMGLKDLIRKLLVKDPDKRLKMEDLLKHPWVTTNLPPRALEMNEDVSIPKAPTKAEEWICELVREAQTTV